MTDRHQSEHEQARVTELLRSFDNVPAPDSLHRRIESMVAARPRSHGRRRSPLALAGAGIAVVAIVAVGLAVALGGGPNVAGISFEEAVAPTLRAATLPAPVEDPANHAQLVAAVDGIAFPDWSHDLGWRSTGARTDRVDHRSITTVFYVDSRHQRIGYAIVAGAPAPESAGGTVDWTGGVPYRVLSSHGATTVTWLRDGHLCVLAGRGVAGRTLVALASWGGGGTSPS